MIRRIATIALGQLFLSAWAHLVLSPFYWPARFGDPVESLAFVEWIGGPSASFEAVHGWAVAASLGGAVALVGLGAGRLCSSGQSAWSALGAALLFALTTAGLGYTATVAIVSALDLLDKLLVAPGAQLFVVAGLVTVSIPALAGTILAIMLAVSWAGTFGSRRSAANEPTRGRA
ncbi:MAG: hypothetical protein AVDCRST_MAG70-2365 [uncultured Thermomicrobiales bacterium]|uniref:Uncharacterized protein n=1 Tax=uncultured Thermomicrobiales bacterium TaxID=1645740 RepID=A0A6J4V6E7_9BACT|nr:MAG: hypothetical protein AVDCRST_MAG70-2365 [uncultured Thermomicrobiales bacterium]